MAAAGYLVFYDNYRGSSSYGKAFGNLLQGKYSSAEDFQDHMSGIDRLIEEGKADSQQFICRWGFCGRDCHRLRDRPDGSIQCCGRG